MIVKVNWSGGKDSTTALDLHLNKGHIVKAVAYIPYLTENIPLICKDQFEFILRTKERFEGCGANISIVSGETYFDYCTRRAKVGKNKGKMFGYPCFIKGKCGFKRDSKIKALENFDVGEYDYEDIGIAYDETERSKQMSWTYGNYQTNLFEALPSVNDKIISILCEEKMTKADNIEYCRKRGLLSPIYLSAKKRDGCALCPNAKEDERKQYFCDYPEAVVIVKELQDILKIEKPEQFPLRNHKLFLGG